MRKPTHTPWEAEVFLGLEVTDAWLPHPRPIRPFILNAIWGHGRQCGLNRPQCVPSSFRHEWKGRLISGWLSNTLCKIYSGSGSGCAWFPGQRLREKGSFLRFCLFPSPAADGRPGGPPCPRGKLLCPQSCDGGKRRTRFLPAFQRVTMTNPL